MGSAGEERSGELDQDVPLPALFQRARDVLKQLDSGPARGAGAQQELVAQGTAALRAAAAAVDALALFSPNEDRDDLATGDIKYLLIPFYHAEVQAHTHAADPRVRLAALMAAAQHYRAFLHRCLQYSLLSPAAAAMAQTALKQPEEEEEEGSGSGASLRTLDAATLRAHKIEKFKREKYIKGRLEALERQRQGGGAAGGAAGGEDGGEAAEAGDWEEGEREVWMLQVDLAALQAAERQSTVQQEVQILRHAAALPEDERQRQRERREQQGAPADVLRQLHAAAGNLAGAGAQRERLAAGVFRPSHALPSMSVEQFGELEYRRMLEAQQREAAAKERAERERAEKSEEQLEEEELREARAWDDFKDDNPRGWGNSKLRPCA